MKRKILAIVLVLVLVLSCVAAFTACKSKKTDAEYILDKGTLICGITLYEPMNYFNNDGDLVGFDTEFAEAVAEKLGIEAKFQVIKWSSKEIELNSKYIDCIWNGFTVTEQRKENITFTQSYLNNTQCVVIKASNAASFANEEACAGKRAVAEAGSAGETAANELTTNVTPKGAQVDALTEVKSGTADFAVVDVVLANSMVGQGDYADLAIATGIQLESEEYAIGFRKGSDMAEKVNAVIADLLADGTLQTLAEKYGVAGQLIK